MKDLMSANGSFKCITINGKKVRLHFIEDLDEGVYRLTIWEMEE
jgi:hypothetical protein